MNTFLIINQLNKSARLVYYRSARARVINCQNFPSFCRAWFYCGYFFFQLGQGKYLEKRPLEF